MLRTVGCHVFTAGSIPPAARRSRTASKSASNAVWSTEKALADKAPKIAIHAQPVFAMEARFDPCLNEGLEGRDAYCRPSC